MPISVARILRLSAKPARAGTCIGLAAFLIAIATSGLQNATADGDTRTISFHHIHTGEDLTITYKVNGQYDEEALKKIDYELRDWRRDETIHMDPHLIDLVWEVHRDVGAKGPIWVVCGYRSPETNAMLRQRSSGVAKFSQHMLGKAMDFYIPGVPLEQLRAVGLYLQRGGVGFYPTSGSPFVHLDTGNVRHWPSIAANEMPRLMTEGHDLHAAAAASDTGTNANRQPVVAQLSGGHPATSREPVVRAAAVRPEARKGPVVDVAVEVEHPGAAPAVSAASKAGPAPFELASAESRPIELRPSQTADLPSANDMINQRLDYWHSAQSADATPPSAPPPPARQAALPRRTAAAEPQTTASVTPWPLPERGDTRSPALAYADPNIQIVPPRAAAMGGTTVRPVAPPATTVAVKRTGDRPTVIASPPPAAPASPASAKSGDRFNEPWLRALIVSPSVQDFMSASSFGVPDYRSLASFLRKPSATVMMTLSDDPQLDMPTSKFSGSAVVFVPTVTFGTRTASLR